MDPFRRVSPPNHLCTSHFPHPSRSKCDHISWSSSLCCFFFQYPVNLTQTEKSVSNKPYRSLWPIHLLPNYFGPSDYYTKVTECTVICLFLAYVSNPITGLERAWVFQEVDSSRFKGNRHMKVVRLSALHTGRLYPQENIPCTHFNPRAVVRPEGLCQWKIPMIQSGIEHSTFRLVAQCLYQLRHRLPFLYSYM